MKTIIIAAPSIDGKVSVWHATALSETAKLGVQLGVNVVAIYMSFDSLLQRARNDIFKLAYENKVDDLIFIDADIDWNPQDVFKLTNSSEDIVAVAICKKSDIEQYNVKAPSGIVIGENGLAEVEGVGTGFMRISKAAINKMWEVSAEYNEVGKQGTPSRMVFEIAVIDGNLFSEDIMFCKKWRDLGNKVYIDPSITAGHSGDKRYIGNIIDWLNRVAAYQAEQDNVASKPSLVTKTKQKKR